MSKETFEKYYCDWCDEPIEKYSSIYHRFKTKNGKTFDVCQFCQEDFIKKRDGED